MLISDWAEYILKIVYISLTIVLFLLMFFDLSFGYFGLMLSVNYFVVKVFYERLIIIGIAIIYLICSLIFVIRLDPLLALQQFILQGSVSTMFEMYIFMGSFILLGILVGLTRNQVRLFYMSIVMIGTAIVNVILDMIVFSVIISNYIINGLYYFSIYFLCYNLEFTFWFIIIYTLKQYLIVELEEPETIVEVSRPS